MTNQRQEREWCPECLRRASGFKKLYCVGCGALSTTAGFGGRTERQRLRSAEPAKQPRYSFSSIL